VYGTLHVSTSPNGEGRRARVSLQHEGRVTEIIEPLEPGTFTSESITFDGGSEFSFDVPGLSGAVTSTPHMSVADFSGDHEARAFTIVPDEPLIHYEQAATITGNVTVGDTEIELHGYGFRDRSWGWRDESVSVVEYFGFMWVFDDFGITGNRALGADGVDYVTIFRVTETDAIAATSASLTRDASGLFAATHLEFADGTPLDVRGTHRAAGFWCPMGWERTGPTLSTYDEFQHVRTSDGREGFGLIEQGITRQQY
jgi:hypothetical protein